MLKNTIKRKKNVKNKSKSKSKRKSKNKSSLKKIIGGNNIDPNNVISNVVNNTTNLAHTLNQSLSNPQIKNELETSMKNLGELAGVAVDSLKEPAHKAINIAKDEIEEATSEATSGAIKVGTDMMAAIPFWGAIVELGKIVNDGSKAFGSVVEAGTNISKAVSDAVNETKIKFDNAINVKNNSFNNLIQTQMPTQTQLQTNISM